MSVDRRNVKNEIIVNNVNNKGLKQLNKLLKMQVLKETCIVLEIQTLLLKW